MMNKLMNFRKNKKGFTLVEIIVVLVIIAILAAIAIPTMMGFVRDAQDQALIAEARTAYYAAQSIATREAGSALVSGVGTVTYANSEADWLTEINTYLDSAAANVRVVLQGGGLVVRPGMVAEIYYQKEAGGRVVRIVYQLETIDGTTITAANPVGTTVGDAGEFTLPSSTLSQTVAAGGAVTNA